MDYTILKENKVHIFGLNYREEKYVEQYLTSTGATYVKLGSDFFIWSYILADLQEHLLRVAA